MKHGVKLIVMGILSLFGSKASASVEADFWKWFQKNEDMIFNFERDTENTFDKLSAALSKVDPELTFEFSPIRENGKREFVISAGGIKNSFSSVELLFNSAPEMKKWIIIKFRPRRSPLNDLNFGGVSIKSEDVYYNLYKDEDKLGIVLFFDNYNEKEHTTYGNLGYLFLDEALGEYDVETKLGFVEFHNKTSEYFDGAKPIKNLSKQVDEYYGN
ncbi:hypothetical protein K0H59_10065 [Shewanella sp. FJAT-51649]|uniref:hypothetical protein n=1 Tax=Shewanella sp. FJAT-51649 TaxID=2864210 RepID=UPI001C655C23|nr:hypothetical protein [Shewanella sp. FJAT-51649]QYJ73318.1 hypothetical protein K0H59_10065 [Shewanella sp. FJAT-51649]